jgi:argininosuccinate synthase
VEEVIAFAADLGQGDELDEIKKKAILAGASESLIGNLV